MYTYHTNRKQSLDWKDAQAEHREGKKPRKEGKGTKKESSHRSTPVYYAHFQSYPSASSVWTSTLREAPSESSSCRAASSGARKRVSMYSLAKGVGTEIVRVCGPRATAVTVPNHTLREEASMSSLAFSSTRPQSPSAAGSGVGGGKPSGSSDGRCSVPLWVSLWASSCAITEDSKEGSKDSWSCFGGSGRA